MNTVPACPHFSLSYSNIFKHRSPGEGTPEILRIQGGLACPPIQAKAAVGAASP